MAIVDPDDGAVTVRVAAIVADGVSAQVLTAPMGGEVITGRGAAGFAGPGLGVGLPPRGCFATLRI